MLIGLFGRWVLLGIAASVILVPVAIAWDPIVESIAQGAWLNILPLFGLVLLVIMAVFHLTKSPDGESMEQLRLFLESPVVRRNVMRLEIGGIIAGVIALIFATWGLQQANDQSQLARAALRDQRISAAWQILAQPGQGSSGKKYALEILLSHTQDNLTGLSLGCHDDCEIPTILAGGKFIAEPTDGKLRRISKSDFASADFEGADFANLRFEETSFKDANFSNTTTFNVSFQGSLEGARFTPARMSKMTFAHVNMQFAQLSGTGDTIGLVDVDLTNGSIRGSWREIQFDGVNLTDARLAEAEFINSSSKTARVWPFGGGGGDGGTFTEIEYSPTTKMHVLANKELNISGAEFCQSDWETSKIVCAQGITDDFLAEAWFFEENPPIGLDIIEPDLLIRPGCPSPPFELPVKLSNWAEEDAVRFSMWEELMQDCRSAARRPVSSFPYVVAASEILELGL